MIKSVSKACSFIHFLGELEREILDGSRKGRRVVQVDRQYTRMGLVSVIWREVCAIKAPVFAGQLVRTETFSIPLRQYVVRNKMISFANRYM